MFFLRSFTLVVSPSLLQTKATPCDGLLLVLTISPINQTLIPSKHSCEFSLMLIFTFYFYNQILILNCIFTINRDDKLQWNKIQRDIKIQRNRYNGTSIRTFVEVWWQRVVDERFRMLIANRIEGHVTDDPTGQ